MIIVLCNDKVLIWGIPPLSPHPPDLLNNNPTPISPLLKTSLPNDITRNSKYILWEGILDWYAGSSQSIHLGVSDRFLDLTIHNVEIVIKPDLSDISLYVINTCQLAPNFHGIMLPQYHILEDHIHVSEINVFDSYEKEIYIRSTSSRPPDIISPESPIVLKLSIPDIPATPASCPTSGRFVYLPRDNYRTIVVADYLKYDFTSI